ncbi:MAG: type II secretion system protein GspD [Phycisphaerales bacterium]|nr:type II secretion system protein GspD [Phycisphaerales bacterium]
MQKNRTGNARFTPATPRRAAAQVGAAGLVLLAGGVAAIAAAPISAPVFAHAGAQPVRSIAQPGLDEPQPERSPEAIERDAEARLRAFEERRRAAQAAREQARNTNQRVLGPGADAPPIENADDPLLKSGLDPDSEIDITLRESQELLALLDYTSRTLGINIVVDDSLQSQSVTLKAPIKLKARQLLPFVSALLEERGFVMSPHPQGFYVVTPAAQAPMALDGILATTRIVPTPMVRPSALEPVLSGTLNLAQNAAALRITSLDELGLLVLTGGPTMLDRAEQLIDRIIFERADQKLHRFELSHVSADFAIERILELNGKITGGTIGGVQVQPNIPGQPGRNSVTAGSLTNLDTRLFVDRGNAVLFRGSVEEASEVGSIVEAVDVITSLIARRYVAGSVTLEVARAAEGLGLGSITTVEDTSQAFQQQSFNRPQGLQQLERASTISGSRFVVDPQNGTFTYFGTEAQHARVADLVDDFKKQAVDTGTQIRVYKLYHASAGGSSTGGATSSDGGSSAGANRRGPGVADILTELIQEPGNQLTQGRFLPGQRATGQNVAGGTDADVLLAPTGGDDAGAAGGTRLVATSENTIIVSDPARNQLIIKAPLRAHEQLERIIRQLDQPQPQVLVEVRIVSLTNNNDFEYSVDTQINSGQWSWLSTFGVTAPGASITDPLSVGASAATGGIGVTTAIIRSDYVPFAINALKTEGKARILSQPRLLVNDNQEGTVDSVREEPFATTTQTAGNPVQTSQGGQAEAGTKLTVTPQISADQSVILDFSIELSSFDLGAQQPNLSPPKQTETYESVVTVPWDSTIIVGGFRFEQESNAQSKVPLLGEVPIVGDLLFKSTQKRNDSRTIFVFITPRVISDVKGGGLQLMTEGPLAQASLSDGEPLLLPALMPVRSAQQRLIDQLEAEAQQQTALSDDNADLPPADRVRPVSHAEAGSARDPQRR